MAMNEETVERNFFALKGHGDETRKLLREAQKRLDNMETQLTNMDKRLDSIASQAAAALGLANNGGATA